MAILDLLKKKKNEFLSGVDVVKDAVSSGAKSVGNAWKDNAVGAYNTAKNDLSVFIPKDTPQKTAIDNALQGYNPIQTIRNNLFTGTAKFGASVGEIPLIARTGNYTDKTYKVPGLSPFKSLQSDFGDVANDVISGKKGMGSAAWSLAQVPLTGMDTAGTTSAVGQGFKLAQKVFPKSKVANELGNIADDLSTRLGQTRVIPGKVDTLPARWGNGGKVFSNEDNKIVIPQGSRSVGPVQETMPGSGARFYQNTEKALPAQSIRRTADRVARVPFQPKSRLFQGVMKPGLTIEDVSGGVKGYGKQSAPAVTPETVAPKPPVSPKPSEIPLLPQGQFRTVNQAKKSFENTGRVPLFKNTLRPKTKPLEMPMSQRDQAITDIMNAPKVVENAPLALPGGKPILALKQPPRQAPLNTLRPNKRTLYAGEGGMTTNLEKATKEMQMAPFNTPQGGEAGKQLSKLRQFITSGGTVLKKSGKSGTQMEGLMRKQLLEQDMMAGKWSNYITNTFKGLSKAEKENVTDVLEGAAQPISPQSAMVAEKMRAFYDDIAKQAEQRAFTIRTPDGAEVPFSARDNYSPRIYNWDEMTKAGRKDKAIQHLVQTGQAKNRMEAQRMFENFISANAERRAGNLENARMFDIPGYEKDAEKAARMYAQSVSGRFTQADNFGKKDEIVNELINRVFKEGGDDKEAAKIFEYMYRGLPKNKLASAITQYNLATKLDLGAITNLSQNVNTITKAGFGNTMKAIVKGFTKEGRDIAEQANVYDDIVNLKESVVNPARIVRTIMTPFAKVERFNRRTSALAGVERAKQLAGRTDDFAVRQLESLGLNPEKLASGKLTQEDILTAANKMAELTQFKPNVLNTPRLWKTPLGRVAMQFKSFSFMQTRFITDEIIKEAGRGNLMPLARFLTVVPLASYLMYGARNAVTGRDPKKEEVALDIRTLDKYSRAGGSFYTDPISQTKFLADTYGNDNATPMKKITRTASTFFGPTAGTAGNLLTALEDKASTEKNNRMYGQSKDANLALKREAVGNIPFAGEYVKNTAFAFPAKKTDLMDRATQTAQGGMIPTAHASTGQPQPSNPTFLEKVFGAKPEAAEIAPGAFAMPDGTFSWKDETGEVKSTKNKQKAIMEAQKVDFAGSDEKIRHANGYVFRKNAYGEAQPPMREVEYDYKLTGSGMALDKAKEDYQSWIPKAEKQITALENLLNDPMTDELDRTGYEKDLVNLIEDYQRYQSYGGFKKPKSSGGASTANPYKGLYPAIDLALMPNLKGTFRKPRKIRSGMVRPSSMPLLPKINRLIR